MHVAIIGAGSIGCLLGGYLARAGMDVTLVTKKNRPLDLARDGLLVERSFDGSSFIQKGIVFTDSFDVVKDSSLVLVSVKVFDLERVMHLLDASRCMNPEKHVMCLVQNGLGVERVCRDHFPGVPLLRITTTHGAAFAGSGKVQHTGSGTIRYGFWDGVRNPPAANIVETLHAAFESMGAPGSVHLVDEITGAVWEKFIVNVGINAVGTIFNVTNGLILAVPEIHDISTNLVNEAMRVGFHLGHLKGFDGNEAVRSVATATSVNKNSMLQDMSRGRRTEIDFINGMVCTMGRDNGIATPWNDVIVTIIHGMERIRNGLVNA